MIRNITGRKNARVFLLSSKADKSMFLRSLRYLSTEIKAPTDRLKPEPVTLNIGDYATLERQFTKEDIEMFAVAAQDKHAAHLNPENAKTFYKAGVVYGIFTSSMFSMIVRDLFPGAIYLDQTLKFTAPVMVDDKVTAKMVITDIKEDKKIVTFKTTVTKADGEKVAITGDSKFLIPHLHVSYSSLYF